MIFVSVNHSRKSTTKSIDFSKMTATTTYSFRKNMCFCISWKMHQKMKRFSNVFLTIFKHVLGNVRFNPTKSFIKIMIFSIKTFLSFFWSVFPRSEGMNFFFEQWHGALSVEKHFRKIIKDVGLWANDIFFKGFIGSNRSIFEKIQILLVYDFLLVFCLIFEGAFWHFGLTSKFC